MSIRWVPALLAAGILAFGAAGCAGKAVNENDPASLFADAEDDIDSDRYAIALEKLRTIRHKFPYSKYSPLAQLRIADVYFLEESFPEAAASYETFRDLHPKHEKASYAMYRIGESYFEAMPENVARDMTTAYEAIDAFEAYLNRYPKGEHAEQARKRLGESRSRLARKELYVADFYFKRDFPDAAMGRYEKVVRLYPKTEAAEKAKQRLSEIRKSKNESPES